MINISSFQSTSGNEINDNAIKATDIIDSHDSRISKKTLVIGARYRQYDVRLVVVTGSRKRVSKYHMI